jgi:hypothetical protein
VHPGLALPRRARARAAHRPAAPAEAPPRTSLSTAEERALRVQQPYGHPRSTNLAAKIKAVVAPTATHLPPGERIWLEMALLYRTSRLEVAGSNSVFASACASRRRFGPHTPIAASPGMGKISVCAR